jgi:hypothetical protein
MKPDYEKAIPPKYETRENAKAKRGTKKEVRDERKKKSE